MGLKETGQNGLITSLRIVNSEPLGASQNPLEGTKTPVEQWRDAHVRSLRYGPGIGLDEEGKPYNYGPGKRLLIHFEGRWQAVMDTAETPWCEATAEAVFSELKSQRTDPTVSYPPPRVLELGYGIGILNLFILRGLHGMGGGSVTTVELNTKVYEYAKNRIARQLASLVRFGQGLPGTEHNIYANIIPGDADQVLDAFGEKIEKGEEQPFDIIVSDRFPTEESDVEGTVDLKNMLGVRRCLARNGIFSYFVWFPGTKGGIYGRQEDILRRNGFVYSYKQPAYVKPPPSYEYLLIDRELKKSATLLDVVTSRKQQFRVIGAGPLEYVKN